MPFIERNEVGDIVGVSDIRQIGSTEELSADQPEVAEFLSRVARMFAPAITDVQFFHALALAGTITQDEALAAVQTGTLPAAMLAAIAQLPADQRFAAELKIAGDTIFHRNHPLVDALAAKLGWTAQQADDLWRSAAAL
jgi:hypothetical protein